MATIAEVVRLYVEDGNTLRDIAGRIGARCEMNLRKKDEIIIF